MKHLQMILAALTVVAVMTAAIGAEEQKWAGYLIDKQCAEAVREDPDPTAFVQRHNKDCALMPNCKKVGYSVYSSRKWFDLDREGDALAIKLLQTSKRQNGFYVEIVGSRSGKVLKVKTIREIAEPQVGGEDRGTK